MKRSARDFTPLIDRLRLVFRMARIAMADDTQSPQRLQIVTNTGETEDGLNRWQPHGLRSLPVAGAQALILSFGGFRRNSMVIQVDAGVQGEAYLQPGDVALDDYRGLSIRLTATEILIQGNGLPVRIAGASKLRAECPIESTGEITANCDSAPIPLSTHVTTDVVRGGAESGPPAAP